MDLRHSRQVSEFVDFELLCVKAWKNIWYFYENSDFCIVVYLQVEVLLMELSETPVAR